MSFTLPSQHGVICAYHWFNLICPSGLGAPATIGTIHPQANFISPSPRESPHCCGSIQVYCDSLYGAKVSHLTHSRNSLCSVHWALNPLVSHLVAPETHYVIVCVPLNHPGFSAITGVVVIHATIFSVIVCVPLNHQVRQCLCGRVPDLQWGGCRFESRPGLLHTKVYSAFHPSRVGK